MFSDKLALHDALLTLHKYCFIRWKSTGKDFSIHPLIQYWTYSKLQSLGIGIDDFRRCALGIISSSLEPQDLLPPMAPMSDTARAGEERSLPLFPWRTYPDLRPHAEKCLLESLQLRSANRTTCHHMLSLLLICHPFETSEQPSKVIDVIRRHRCLETMITHEALLQDRNVTKDSVYLFCILWEIYYSQLCRCRKYFPGPTLRARPFTSPILNPTCSKCLAYYENARFLYDEAALMQKDLENEPQPYFATFHDIVPFILLPLYKNALSDSFAHSVRRRRDQLLLPNYSHDPTVSLAQPKRSTFENYVWASRNYYNLISGDDSHLEVANLNHPFKASGLHLKKAQHDGEGYGTCDKEPLRSFRKICGPKSEEYRRCMYHMTSALVNKGRWQDVIDALLPLVHSSITRPSTSWSHERCLIRTLHAYCNLGRHDLAKMLSQQTEAAYRAAGLYLKSLKALPDSLVAAKGQVRHSHAGKAWRANSSQVEPSSAVNSPSTALDPKPREMQVFIKDSKTLCFTVNSHDLVAALFEQFRDKQGPPPSYIRLLYGGKQLQPDRFIYEYGISNGSTVHVVDRLLGGCSEISSAFPFERN